MENIAQQLREITDPERDEMDGSIEGTLVTLRRTREALDLLTRQEVASARSQGLSWAQIGGALGMSKQAAHERFS